MPVHAEAVTSPKTCQIGVYLTSLRDFNLAEKSFAANFRVWSVCPFETPKPLESLKVINSKEVSKNYTSFSRSENLSDTFKASKNLFWSEQEMSTTIYHNWDIKNYPFDRHVLQIPLEETQLDASIFVHSPDFAKTGYPKYLNLEGWEIRDFRIAQENFPYRTSFGSPGIKRELNYRSRLVISITINRNSKTSFFKLAIGVYAAVALSIMALLLDEYFGALGSTNSVTLIDFIHMIAIIYIFISAILLVYTRFLSESDQPSRYLMRRIAVPILAGSFVVLNIVVISYAAIVG
ncbi:MAG: hypothetical protein EAZ09_10040 [Oscillatoriales cyanobacterium]|nr:MAG: hypothetical protein EAZ09_10040 [Oscillatoriales cyanobacterium]